MWFNPPVSFTYQDIGLVPTRTSTVTSRSHISTSTRLGEIDISLPILLAPMDDVVDEDMEDAIRYEGGMCIAPRDAIFMPRHAGSVSTKNLKDAEALHTSGKLVCIDTANGNSEAVGEAIDALKSKFPNIFIIAGNVASTQGYAYLKNMGADAVRVGIGGGSVCTTSIATGVGVGQASIVRAVADFKHNVLNGEGPLIIADGGIKYPGDVVKALALGADLVMCGGVFAGAEESPGTVIKHGGRKWKRLAGQASMAIKGQREYIEGADVLVPYTGPVSKTWNAFKEGIESGMSYMNCMNLEELIWLPDENFVRLTDAAKAERKVHA